MASTGSTGRTGRTGSRVGGASFWFGVAEALLVPLAFVALGLAWWGAAVPAEAGTPSYAANVEAPDPATELWLVDGFNVVQVALLAGRDRTAWWTAPHRGALLRRARRFDAGAAELWIAFDGDRPEGGTEEGVRSIFVRSADAWLLERVRAAPDPSRVRVVTADRRLAARVRHHGAEVVTPRAFLDRCGVEPSEAADEGLDTTPI